ncbi:hypothetical protein VPH526E571_0045 [Vibrio phage 526E57-1]
MARGARMSEQRRSARETMDRRERGDSRERSRGSSYNKAGGGAERAERNRREAVKRDKRKELATKAGTSAPKVQPRPTVTTHEDITGEAEKAGYKQGFTIKADAINAGNVAGLGLGSTAGSLVEHGVEALSDAMSDTPSGPLEAAGRTAGKAAASQKGLGLGGGLGEKAISAGLGALGPVGSLVKAGLEADALSEHEAFGEKTLDSRSGTRKGRVGGTGSDRDSGSSTTTETSTSTPAAPASSAVPEPVVTSINPSIGIAKGTDKRKANFAGSIAVRGKKANKKRGKV